MAKSTDIPSEYSHDWLERLDGRTRTAQVVRGRYHDLAADLGGLDNLSYQRRSLVKRAVFMEAVIEQQEAALCRGEEVDQGRMAQSINTLIGLLKTLGLDRVGREVPNLSEYLAASRGAR